VSILHGRIKNRQCSASHESPVDLPTPRPLLIAIRFSNAAAEENYFPLGGDDSARLLGSAGTGHKGAGFLRLEQAAENHEGYRHALRLLGVAESEHAAGIIITRSLGPDPGKIPGVGRHRKECLQRLASKLLAAVPTAAVVLKPAGTVAPRGEESSLLEDPRILAAAPDPNVGRSIVVRCVPC
jgi:hypothetical protein